MAKILIAEDEDAVRLLVARGLRLDGHEVIEAEDGEMALEIATNLHGQLDLILSDIRMPAMTGIELAHAVAERWPDLPVLLMTGYAEQKEAADELEQIIKGVLDKPFAIAEVRQRVAEILKRSVARLETAFEPRRACA